jgi:hypothetical protein
MQALKVPALVVTLVGSVTMFSIGAGSSHAIENACGPA